VGSIGWGLVFYDTADLVLLARVVSVVADRVTAKALRVQWSFNFQLALNQHLKEVIIASEAAVTCDLYKF
jgi:hypothetical protein